MVVQSYFRIAGYGLLALLGYLTSLMFRPTTLCRSLPGNFWMLRSLVERAPVLFVGLEK